MKKNSKMLTKILLRLFSAIFNEKWWNVASSIYGKQRIQNLANTDKALL